MGYSNLVPADMPGLSASLQPASFKPNLFPFQRKSVEFMAGREGRFIEGGSEGLVQTTKGPSQIGLWFEQIDGDLCFNSLHSFFTRDKDLVRRSNVKGGVFAEEMGLGKTIELLGVVLLNQAPERSFRPQYNSKELQTRVKPVSATLIVAPETLRQQWIDEANLHAKDLRVYSYTGHAKASKDTPEGLNWPQWIAKNFDMVVVSFEVLQREVHVARKDLSLPRRKAPVYERTRSPLIQTDWHRVVMDEVQLMKGSGNAAEIVSMITRDSSIAVSGTLVRKAEDLAQTFDFLRVGLTRNDFVRLTQQPLLAPALVSALQVLVTRTMKASVQSELNIATQTRTLVPLELNGIELAFYKDLLHRFFVEAGCDENGNLEEDKSFDRQVLRNHLLYLRQCCLHPQQVSGSALNGALGAPNSGLRSIDEVLTTMIDKVKAELNSDRAYLKNRIQAAQLMLADVTLPNRQDKARVQLETLKEQISERVAQLDEEIKQLSMEEGGDDEDSGDEGMVGGKTSGQRAGFLRLRKIEWLEQLHRVHHFLGAVYFQMAELKGDPKWKDLETKSYSDAEDLRNSLFRQPKKNIEKYLSLFKQGFAELDLKVEELIPKQEWFPKWENGSARSALYFKDLNKLVDLLTENAHLVFEWRSLIINKLSQSVDRDVGRENEEDDQYQENLEAQLEAESHLEVYHPLLAEREKIVTGKTAPGALSRPATLVQLEARFKEVKDRHPKYGVPEPEESEEEETAEGDVVKQQYLNLKRLDKLRARIRLKQDALSVEGLVSQLSNVNEKPEVDEPEESSDEDKDEDEDDEFFGEGKREQKRKAKSLRDKKKRKAEKKKEKKREKERELEKEKEWDEVESEGNGEDIQMEGEGVAEKEEKIPLTEEELRQEVVTARQGMTLGRELSKEQSFALARFKKEEILLMELYRARAAYFKSMQEFSDAVQDVSTRDPGNDLMDAAEEEKILSEDIKKKKIRLRYLKELENAQSSSDTNDEGRLCFICTDQIRTGILTECGHITCERCFKNWTESSNVCPACRAGVSIKSSHRIVYKKATEAETQCPKPPAFEGGPSSIVTRASKQYEFNEMDENHQAEVSRIPVIGRFGTKLEFLLQHLIHIDATSRDKTLVFTSFSRGLDFVAESLKRNAIRFERLNSGASAGRAVERFKEDDRVNVLLLHSESQSSGLNLLCASRVFFMEPLVNHAFELQAIARVSRIGATRVSHIYCLYVKDTVEERILNLAAKRKRSLYLKNGNEEQINSSILDVKSREDQPASAIKKLDAKGDLVSNDKDLLACLFDDREADGGSKDDEQTHRREDSSSSQVSS